MAATGTPRPYGVLILGAGWVAAQHIAAFAAHPAARIVAVASRSIDSARRCIEVAGLVDVRAHDDVAEALAHADVDVVAVCTPQHLHAEHVIAAARAGKHLVIEKPVANSLADVRRMQAAVHAAGVRTVVSFVLRWNPLFRELKARIASGAVGRPYYVEADYLSHNGSWWSGWNDARTLEGGVSAMLVGGCHAVDALRWFAAEGEFSAATPVEVFAMRGGLRKGSTREYDPRTHAWVDDVPPMEYEGLEAALVRFDNGVLGKISVNAECILPYRFPLRVFGDRGTILDHHLWSPGTTSPPAWLEVPGTPPDSSDVSHHPFRAEIDHFLACLTSGVESHCNLDDAVLTHEVVFAAQECYRTNRPVPLPLATPASAATLG
jgi:predicted dehydrogenase